MADKKKMSVADMIAAARKSDSSGDAQPEVDSTPPDTDAAATESAPPQPAKTSAVSGERLSVADMLAAARGEKQAGKAQPPTSSTKKATSAQQSTGKAAARPSAKKPPKPTTKSPATKAPSGGPRDTASILAAARTDSKPGPMSKAEAAKKHGPSQKMAKAPIELPPMPVKPAYAQATPSRPPTPKRGAKVAAAGESDRRGFLVTGYAALAAVLGLWTLATARFMFPNVLREPPSRFKVGFPGDFPLEAVETKYKAQYAVWVVNTEYNGEPQIAALSTVCTHLGCTPNWLEAEQKYKCPCHGSGFYKEGINFEGPAPRPLERYAIRIADDGQIEVDKSRKFQEEMGEWADPACYISV